MYVKIKLKNNPAVPSNNYIVVTIKPIRNAPSLAPLYPFGAFTGDLEGNYIEFWDDKGVGVSLANKQPAEFRSSYRGMSSGLTVSGDSAKTYRFNLVTVNDVPARSKIFIKFPSLISLDCSHFAETYSITAVANMNHAAELACNTHHSRIEINKGFPTKYDCIHAPGPITFDIKGFPNSYNYSMLNSSIADNTIANETITIYYEVTT